MATPNFIRPQTKHFGLTKVGYNSTPTFADIDDDLDLDAFVGVKDGNINYFENQPVVPNNPPTDLSLDNTTIDSRPRAIALSAGLFNRNLIDSGFV